MNHRRELVAYLNGLLGGKLAGESFTLSLSYLFGSVNNNPTTASRCSTATFWTSAASASLRCDLQGWQRRARRAHGKRQQPGAHQPQPPEPVDRSKVEAALAAFSSNCDRTRSWPASRRARCTTQFGEDGFRSVRRLVDAKATARRPKTARGCTLTKSRRSAGPAHAP